MINIENLTFGYTKDLNILDNLTVNIYSGSIYGLLGKNGAGKTTLLKLICGLLFPQNGFCRVIGYNPQKRLAALLQNIYYIPEEFYLPQISINKFKNLYAPFYPKFETNLFLKLIEDFSLDMNQNLSKLSYGEKKKFLICFGISTYSRILIMDEPTNGLDIPTKSKFRRLLAGSINENRCFIISTHQVRDLSNLIDTLIILDNKEIVFNENLEAISKRLRFQVMKELIDEDSIIYSEKIINGYLVIKENTTEDYTNIELETLFNAVLKNKEKISKIVEEGK